MSNSEETADKREESPEISSEKPTLRKWVGINIKCVDGHFLTTFNHDFPRIFHNMQELLAAIEVEASKLMAPSTET